MTAAQAETDAAFCYRRLCRTVEAVGKARPELTPFDIATAIGALVASVISHTRAGQAERMPADATSALTHQVLSIISAFVIEAVTREVSEEQADLMAAAADSSPAAKLVADLILRQLKLAKKDGV